jgi:hypothetical protein
MSTIRWLKCSAVWLFDVADGEKVEAVTNNGLVALKRSRLPKEITNGPGANGVDVVEDQGPRPQMYRGCWPQHERTERDYKSSLSPEVDNDVSSDR